MLADLPTYLYLIFGFSVIYVWYWLYKASNKNKTYVLITAGWILLQSILGSIGFYQNPIENPVAFALLIPPTLILIVTLFLTQKGKNFIQNLDLESLTLLHTVRIPVEIGFLWLFTAGLIPELMTFEGKNFDIIAGLTAQIVYFLYFKKALISKKVLLLWNIVMLGFLLNIVVNALLSAPLPFQQFAFDQPNIGILYFPFNLLPSFIVPAVLFSHLVAIKKLLQD